MRRLLSMIVFLALPLAAQIDRATLTGVVMDPTRSAVATAHVSLHAEATGIDYTLTNSAGVYTFTGLPVGRYTVSMNAVGFEPLRVQTFPLEVGETRTLNATLHVGSVSSNITVVEAAPNLSLTTGRLAESFRANKSTLCR